MLRLAIPITKVDAANRLVYGLATAEVPDRAGEVCDYASTKPLYEKWSSDIAASSGGRSFGNLRAMHGHVAAGKVTAIGFNDEARQIEICAKVVDDGEWAKVTEGVYTGFSQGGRYARRWTDDGGATRYTAEPHEISLVDLPCLAEARFEMIKADGAREWRPFKAEVEKVGARNGAAVSKVGARNSAAVSKVGARNSAADQARVQDMHDTSVALGATCRAIKVSAPGDDLVKSLVCDLARIGDALTALDGALAKRVAALGEGLAKSVAESLAESFANVEARLKRIEDQPLPLPYQRGSRAVAKHEDGADGALDTLLADPATLSLLAIKLAQSRAR